MKNFILLHKGLYVFILWALLAIPGAYAQDVSINILGNVATLPMSTTGSIQVDICNTDPANTNVPVNKLNPQISVEPNVVILGATNMDGSPLANFTVLSNTGQTISLTNLVPITNPSCLSFKVIIRGQTVNAPGSVGGIAAILAFQNTQTTGNRTFNDNSTTSIAVSDNLALAPDLMPIIYLRPSVLYGSSPITLVVDIAEMNSVPTNGVITVKLTRNSKFNLDFNSTDNSMGGRTIKNSDWSFDNSDSNYYVLTSRQVITAGGKTSFGLSGQLNPDATNGLFTISAAIVDVSGELNIRNNIGSGKAEYFQQ